MNRENSDGVNATVIHFRQADCALYGDESVHLTDESQSLLIRKLHDGFDRFKEVCPFRDAGEPNPAWYQTDETSYLEEDWKMASLLTGKSWKTMDLNTAGSLIGYSHILHPNESLALVPFHLEILLRAETWIWPFDLVVSRFRRKSPCFGSVYQEVFEDRSLRQLVYAALEAIIFKYANDPAFAIHKEDVEPVMNTAIRDWSQ